MKAGRYGFRFGRFGTAVVIVTMPLTLPVWALGAGLVEAFEICADTLRTVPSALRYIVRGKP